MRYPSPLEMLTIGALALTLAAFWCAGERDCEPQVCDRCEFVMSLLFWTQGRGEDLTRKL